MASSSAPGPAAPDESRMAGDQWRRASQGRFGWDAPSPSPAEVDELIRLFPEIIQVPVSSLESEACSWGEKALLARSLSRWVPSEAIIRELHRAGIPGAIEVIPLAHRHYLIRLSETQAKDQILGRPWVINGQVLAVADWRPEFVPKVDTLLQALVWIRLPLLPMEFWADDILSSVISVAGEFLYSDEATRARKRGGFARVCARVDLGLPLRPGARVRGTGEAFWQQFSFENVDDICVRCASLHLAGPCLAPRQQESPSADPVFGPWMSAVRRRRPPQEQSSARLAADRSGPAPPPVSKDGWTIPKKLARRQVSPSSSSLGVSPGQGAERAEASGSGSARAKDQVLRMQNQEGSCNLVPVPISLSLGSQIDPRKTETVPVGTDVIIQKAVKENNRSNVPVGTVAQVQISASLSEFCEANTFPKLNLGIGPGSSSPSVDPVSGPPKRARPVELVTKRTPSRSSKSKGKASTKGKGGDLEAFTFVASSDTVRGSETLCCTGAKKARGRVGAARGTGSDSSHLSHQETSSHELAVIQLKQAIQLGDCAVSMDIAQTDDCGGLRSLDHSEMSSGVTEVLMDSAQVAECTDMHFLKDTEEMSGVEVGVLPNPALP